MRPDGSIVVDDSSVQPKWGDPPGGKPKASLHLLKISAGDDDASVERDVIALFTSMFGHPPSEAEMAEAWSLVKKEK